MMRYKGEGGKVTLEALEEKKLRGGKKRKERGVAVPIASGQCKLFYSWDLRGT